VSGSLIGRVAVWLSESMDEGSKKSGEKTLLPLNSIILLA